MAFGLSNLEKPTCLNLSVSLASCCECQSHFGIFLNEQIPHSLPPTHRHTLPVLSEVIFSQVLNLGSSLSTVERTIMFSPGVEPPTTNNQLCNLARPKFNRLSITGDKQYHLLVSGLKQWQHGRTSFSMTPPTRMMTSVK